MSPLHWCPRHRRFTVALLICAAVFVAGSITATLLHGRLVRAERELRGRRTESAKLRAASPTPGHVPDEISRELAAAEQEFVRRSAVWAPATVAPAGDPLLELADFSNRMRTLGQRSGVPLAAAERFGFAEFAHEPPGENDRLRLQLEQRLAEDVLERVLTSGALELVSVQRATRAGPDRFVPPAHLTMAQPGWLTARAVRVVFVGDTGALRSVLNALAQAEARALVLSVEAQPVADSRPHSAHRTRFAVTVERLEAVHAKPEPASPTDSTVRPNAASLRWSSPGGRTALFGEPVGAPALAAQGHANAPRAPFPWRLVRVETPRPRVELLGTTARGGVPCAILRDEETGDIAVLQRGAHSEALGVELLDLAEDVAGDAPAVRLNDLRRRAEIHVGGGSVPEETTRRAVLASVDGPSPPPEQCLALGAQLRVGDRVYRIAAIEAAPPAVEFVELDGTTLPPATVRLEITP